VKGTALRIVLGKRLMRELVQVSAVRLVTVDATELSGSALPLVFKGRRLVGYELRFHTGVVERVMAEGVGLP
jgi:hypothetical protein